ncbi:MAG: PAS domain-containing sensor histidine kinase [Pseudodesulfovibrio sp.]|nr:PAS domain-containing sensor histidine kinase [Pseudodesulfovibrio sp.]
MYLINIASIVLQLAASVFCLRLIPQTDRRWPWILIFIGLAGMVLRRIHVLILMFLGAHDPSLVFELLGLVVSAMMFFGIAQIWPVFRRLKESREKLAESEERFRTVADFTHDWEYWRGPDGAFLYMSPSCERVTGYSRSEFMADPGLMERIVYPGDREAVAAHMAVEMDEQGVKYLDFRIVTADGNLHWLAHCCVPVFNDLGQYVGVRGSNRIIDNRKLAESRLENSRKQYRDLVEQAQAIILELNEAGEIVFLNDFAQGFFGYTLEELQGCRITGTLIPEKDSKGRDLDTMLQDYIHNKDAPIYDELEVVRKNGSRAWVSWASSQVLSEFNTPNGVLFVGIDISEGKAAEKLKEDVERIVRHDIKSPLMGVIGLPRLLQSDENLTPRQKEILKGVEDAGVQMMDLINKSLNLYKLETGMYECNPQSVDWLEIVRHAIRDLSTQHPGYSLFEIGLDGRPALDDDHVTSHGDSTLLYGMAANLLKNGLEASGGKPVCIDFQTGSPCVMEIRNRLPVSPEMTDTFFEKYATHGKSSGTGLGTYSARLAVRAHHGEISMHSSDSEGTVVRVELPGLDESGA